MKQQEPSFRIEVFKVFEQMAMSKDTDRSSQRENTIEKRIENEILNTHPEKPLIKSVNFQKIPIEVRKLERNQTPVKIGKKKISDVPINSSKENISRNVARLIRRSHQSTTKVEEFTQTNIEPPKKKLENIIADNYPFLANPHQTRSYLPKYLNPILNLVEWNSRNARKLENLPRKEKLVLEGVNPNKAVTSIMVHSHKNEGKFLGVLPETTPKNVKINRILVKPQFNTISVDAINSQVFPNIKSLTSKKVTVFSKVKVMKKS